MTGWLVFGALVAAVPAGGWWWMKTHPYGKCRWCRGTGRNWLSTKRRYGVCSRCKGSGRKEWKV